MIKIGNDQLIKRAVSFRNKMNETNCTVEDIMKIYIGIPISDYFYKMKKMMNSLDLFRAKENCTKGIILFDEGKRFRMVESKDGVLGEIVLEMSFLYKIKK